MSFESASPRKRARVEGETSNLPTCGLRKDGEVWLSDGSIVVVAADNVAFRVHKSTLARRSEIFRDLFSLPNADAATAETMDGCPVVYVSDSSDDIRHLFLVLCCGNKYVLARPSSSFFFLIKPLSYYYDGDALIAEGPRCPDGRQARTLDEHTVPPPDRLPAVYQALETPPSERRCPSCVGDRLAPRPRPAAAHLVERAPDAFVCTAYPTSARRCSVHRLHDTCGLQSSQRGPDVCDP